MKKKLLAIIPIFIALLAILYVQSITPTSAQTLTNPTEITTMSINDVMNQQIASRYGVEGYVVIKLAPDTPSTLTIAPGTEKSVTLLITAVSYTSNEDIPIIFDPHGTGIYLDQVYGIYDSHGELVSHGTLHVNDIVNFVPNGTVTLHAGDTLSVTMTFQIPAALTSTVDFPLAPVGIILPDHYALISEIQGDVNA